MRQGSIEPSTWGGADAPLLAQKLESHLASVEEALHDLGTFAFVASQIFSAGGRHLSIVAKLLSFIESLEELHTEGQGMISYTHIFVTLLYNVSWR